ncbi:glycine zipper domain-containing protein [Xanthobacter sp. V4C-4]|uniref:glycine zipper domain-containing protein n=1 Tax=Xanthobacter cornucopiae TaxID=3119924 RepID=UPI00372CDE6A
MFIRAGLAALVTTCLALAGPAPARAQSNAAAGALIGGATGALIGGAVTGRAGGVAAGALIGGTTGALIGAQSDRPEAFYVWGRDGRCYLQNPDGEVVRVSRSHCE